MSASAPSTPPRANVLGVGVSAVNPKSAVERLIGAASQKEKGYVCVTGVHGVIESQDDASLKDIQNNSLLTVPDGMPTVWVGRLTGHKTMRRVYGPDLMLDLCEATVQSGHTHFLYGGQEGVADDLKIELERRFPGLQVVGTYCPPFRPLNEEEEAALQAQVAACKPDFLWVGISTPKQERFMSGYINKLDTHVMLGVGAAFDMHLGRINDAPRWMKQTGLQWFHRLCQEPRRLWKRYLINNPRFIARITLQLLGIVRYPLKES